MSNNYSESARFPHTGIFLTNTSENTWHFLLPAAHEHKPALQSIQSYSHPCRHKPKRWICPRSTPMGGEKSPRRASSIIQSLLPSQNRAGSDSPRYLPSPTFTSAQLSPSPAPFLPETAPALRHGFELLRSSPGQKVP